MSFLSWQRSIAGISVVLSRIHWGAELTPSFPSGTCRLSSRKCPADLTVSSAQFNFDE